MSDHIVLIILRAQYAFISNMTIARLCAFNVRWYISISWSLPLVIDDDYACCCEVM